MVNNPSAILGWIASSRPTSYNPTRKEGVMAERARLRMTEAAFLDWQLGQSDRHELVDGEPRAMTGAKFGHDIVLVNATSLLLSALAAAGGSCRPFSADIVVRVPAGNLRRPDVTVFCQPYDFDAMVSDQPRLVLEVLSDSTRGTDQHQKLDEYKGLISLEYIILIAPHDVDALVWSRQPDRSCVSHRYESLKDRIPLPALGCDLAMADLYAGAEVRTPGPRLVSG
jgi:Uma2 family endonuclease